MTASILTQAELKSQLHYDPLTGIITWAINKPRVMIGYKAGRINPSTGYHEVRVHGIMYKSHRLAFLYMTGSFPENSVDHINKIRDDNRYCNLRQCTQSQNMMNIGLRASNTSGFKGVSFDKKRNKWRARCRINGGIQTNLGFFCTPEEAGEAYREFASKHHGEFFSAK